jgi:hypothetical protein
MGIVEDPVSHWKNEGKKRFSLRRKGGFERIDALYDS